MNYHNKGIDCKSNQAHICNRIIVYLAILTSGEGCKQVTWPAKKFNHIGTWVLYQKARNMSELYPKEIEHNFRHRKYLWRKETNMRRPVQHTLFRSKLMADGPVAATPCRILEHWQLRPRDSRSELQSSASSFSTVLFPFMSRTS